MDHAPTPEPMGPPEHEDVRRRKRRFIERLRGWQTVEPQESLAAEEDAEPGELWNRSADGPAETPETELTLDDSEFFGRARRFQVVGREVLHHAQEAHRFAGAVEASIAAMPAEAQDHVAPEAGRLHTATERLGEATEELDEELEELDAALPAETDAPSADNEISHETSYESPIVPTPKPERPAAAEQPPSIASMARIVVAALVGGGLGMLVAGGPERSKERKLRKEKAKAEATVAKQREKLAAQEAELQQLKAAGPEAGAAQQKAYVAEAGKFTEKQVELTRSTTEQVRAVTGQMAEAKHTFQIPEQNAAKSERPAEPVHGEQQRPAETAEHHEQRQSPLEKLDARRDNRVPETEAPVVASVSQQSPKPITATPPVVSPVQPAGVRRQTTRTWLYAILLGAALLITLALLLFGSK